MGVEIAIGVACLLIMLVSVGVIAVMFSYDTPVPKLVDLPSNLRRRVWALEWITAFFDITVMVMAVLFLTHRLPSTVFPTFIVIVTATIASRAGTLRFRRHRRLI